MSTNRKAIRRFVVCPRNLVHLNVENGKDFLDTPYGIQINPNTVCPRSCDPFHVVSY